MRHTGKRVALILVLVVGLSSTACLHSSRELTCKVKFKRKYDCSFSKISAVENELVLGDQIILVGCGKRVTYNGTTEILVEDE